ncbi:MAG: adenosylcobinamide-phosphate synthase CbiB [Bacillota bacterium]|nr:adenosylcobinamide-phosphate synthase CbiB [Bacillota bacterium]
MIDVIIAVIIDWIMGDPYWFPHPVIYIGKLIGFLEKRGRCFIKQDKYLKLWGGLIVLLVSFICYFVPFIILKLLRDTFWVKHIVNILFLWTTLAARCLHKEGIKVCYSLERNDIRDARVKLSYIVGRETSQLSEEEIIRADVETISENTSDGIIAPLIFGLIGGAPLAMLYKGINTMDSMLGYITPKYKYIGFFPAKVDDIFNFVPARISGMLICLSAPIVIGSIPKSIKIMLRDRKNHKSPNCAYPEAATAGALQVQLGGTNTYFGEKMYKPTIGDKINHLNEKHIKDTIRLMYTAEILCLIFSVILYSAIRLL